MDAKTLVAILLLDSLLLAGFTLGMVYDWGVVTWLLLGASLTGTPLLLFAVTRNSRGTTDRTRDEFGR